jgi:ribosomal protein L1
MVINLLARAILQPACRANGPHAAIGAISARLQGALDDRTTTPQWPLINYVQNRGAARKGKRIQRAREARLRAAKRRLLEAQNPKNKNKKKLIKVDTSQLRFQTERELDSRLPDPPMDDVFFMEKFRRKRFSLFEILEFHRQAVHPDVLNKPDSLVQATIELNLKMKIKKKRYIEKIESTLRYPHVFKYEIRPRKIVALCKDEADQLAAREAGAILAGGKEIVDQLKKNQLTTRDFDHIVCHSNFLEEFASVKGMKSASFFPTQARGNFGENIAELVRYFKDGIDYSLKKDPDEPSFGFIDCYFGKLDMSNEQLRDNLIALFKSVSRFKPLNLADNKQFFERVIITTPATTEMFLLKFWELTDEYKDPDMLKEEEDDENQAGAAKA